MKASILGLIAGLLVGFGWAQKTLVFGSNGEPVSLESGNVTDGISIYVQHQIYNRLLDFKPGTTELVGSLATSWYPSTDGRVWTFRLRQGVRFHDGTELDAQAVKFNFERWWDPQHPSRIDAAARYEIWPKLFGGFKGDPKSVLREIQVVDKYTVRFVLNRPFPAFPSAVASGYFGIASPSAIQKEGGRYGSPTGSAVGTGPFRLVAWRPGQEIVLERNPNYWRQGYPKVDRLVLRVIRDPAARLAALKAGAIDLTTDIPPANLRDLEADPNLDPVLRPSFNVGYLALNPSYRPLADPRVRHAIASAINKRAIVQAFWGRLGITDGHFTPPSMKAFQSPKVSDYTYNPERARALLREAGYPNGFDLDFWYMPVSRPYFPNPKEIAEAMAADLSAVGIRARLLTKDWASYLSDRNKSPGFPAYMLGWTGDYGDPQNFYDPHFAAPISDLFDPEGKPLVLKELDEILRKAATTPAQAERKRLYQLADEITFELALRIPIVHSQPLLAKRRNVTGWTPSPLGSEPLEAVEKR